MSVIYHQSACVPTLIRLNCRTMEELEQIVIASMLENQANVVIRREGGLIQIFTLDGRCFMAYEKA